MSTDCKGNDNNIIIAMPHTWIKALSVMIYQRTSTTKQRQGEPVQQHSVLKVFLHKFTTIIIGPLIRLLQMRCNFEDKLSAE